jgi:hypothetical protein
MFRNTGSSQRKPEAVLTRKYYITTKYALNSCCIWSPLALISTEADLKSDNHRHLKEYKQGEEETDSPPSLSNFLAFCLKDYFLSIPNEVELFSSNFTFFSVFDIPVGRGKDVNLVRKLKIRHNVLNYNCS